MDSRTKALESMSRAQSDHFRKYGEHDPMLQRRIDLLMKKAKATPTKKKPAAKKSVTKKTASTKTTAKKAVAKKTDPEKPYYTKPTPGKGGKWNIAKATPKKKKTVAKKTRIRKLA